MEHASGVYLCSEYVSAESVGRACGCVRAACMGPCVGAYVPVRVRHACAPAVLCACVNVRVVFAECPFWGGFTARQKGNLKRQTAGQTIPSTCYFLVSFSGAFVSSGDDGYPPSNATIAAIRHCGLQADENLPISAKENNWP